MDGRTGQGHPQAHEGEEGGKGHTQDPTPKPQTQTANPLSPCTHHKVLSFHIRVKRHLHPHPFHYHYIINLQFNFYKKERKEEERLNKENWQCQI
jgi:hypothetical protein